MVGFIEKQMTLSQAKAELGWDTAIARSMH